MSENKTPTLIQKNEYPHEYRENRNLDILAQHIESTLVDAMNGRGVIDDRMVQDLRLYTGAYEPDVDEKADQIEALKSIHQNDPGKNGCRHQSA
ncbi:MAG: hypothetical protein U5L02_06395 [Rheinheimera sp.]|nr:hypothetical protein [Rheinheimera sp.]